MRGPGKRHVAKLGFVILISTIAMAGCSGNSAQTGRHWQKVGAIENNYIIFVQVDKGFEEDGNVYHDAVAKLCPNDGCFQMGFFAPDDLAPPSGSRQSFFHSGGWSSYHTLATYMNGEFTQWDCVRAGETAAPPGALCGEGIQAQYHAALKLGGRDGWTLSCGLPEVHGERVLAKFLKSVPDAARRDQFQRAYDQMYQSGLKGPDDPGDCQTLRAGIIESGLDARKTLTVSGAPAKTAVPSS